MAYRKVKNQFLFKVDGAWNLEAPKHEKNDVPKRGSRWDKS